MFANRCGIRRPGNNVVYPLVTKSKVFLVCGNAAKLSSLEQAGNCPLYSLYSQEGRRVRLSAEFGNNTCSVRLHA